MPLEPRKVRILQAIVNDYVLTTRPVGSERLIEVYNIGCKSATVRNEMAEMSDLGYLAQPHTSAGRIPTDRGYRFYVDELMDKSEALSPTEVAQARLVAVQAQNEVEEILQQTCRILSRMTSYASLATDPLTGGTSVRRIYLSEADPRRVLMVLLLSTGHVEHRLIDLDQTLSTADLSVLVNYLNAAAAQHDLDEVGRMVRLQETPPELAAYSATLNRLFAVLAQTAAALSERRVYLEGANQLLRQPEFQDVQRLETLLNALEQRSALHQALSRALQHTDSAIIIGMENGWEPMQECSVITRSYRIGSRTAGYLGVVGPTRMRYDRAVAAVTLMAQNLSNVLTNLSLA